MYRPSKKLIKTIDKYVSENQLNILMIYINNHNTQIWLHLKLAEKQAVFDSY